MVSGYYRSSSYKLLIFSLLFSFALLLGQPARASTFSATVDKTQVNQGDGVRLQLSLSGTTSYSGAPDFTPLAKDFSIISRGQSSQISVINNKATSSITWELLLMPKKKGDLIIPSISIKTDQGILKTQPIKINVGNAPASGKASGTLKKYRGNRAIHVVTNVSSKFPYQNQPIFYSVKLIASKQIANIALPDFKIEGAIVNQQGDPKIYDAVQGGKRVKVVEVNYLITPMQAGKITIPPYTFQGDTKADGRGSGYGGRRVIDPFNDPFFGGHSSNDPFAMLDSFGLFSGLMMQPFAVSSEPIDITVKKPEAAIDPWLPLYSMNVSESFDGEENAKVGEPITRRITMVATGNVGTILPSLEEKIKAEGGDDFRVYADKPEVNSDISGSGNNRKIVGWREESYTIIPQKPGVITLPEIVIPWWNLREEKLEYTKIAEHKIKVGGKAATISGSGNNQSPSSSSQNTPIRDNDKLSEGGAKKALSNAQSAENLALPNESKLKGGKSNNIGGDLNYIYIALIILLIVTAALLVIVIYLFMKLRNKNRVAATADMNKAKENDGKLQAANENRAKNSDILKVENLQDLKRVLQLLAHQRLGMKINSPLKDISNYIKEHSNPDDSAKISALFDALEAQLYSPQGSNQIPLGELKDGFYQVFKSPLKAKKQTKSSKQSTRYLNPS